MKKITMISTVVLALGLMSFSGANNNNKTIVRNFYESYNQKDLDKSFDKYISENLVDHAMGGKTRAWWLATDKTLFPAFTDFKLVVLDQVSEGDKVVTRYMMSAKQIAVYFGVPSNGNTASVEIVTIDRVENGKIVEHWFSADFNSFLQQLAKK